MKTISTIALWISRERQRRRLHKIARIHHQAGNASPYAAAAYEIYLRHKLEDFRDFASKRYLEDRSLLLDDIKDEWLKLVVKPLASCQFTRDDAKALKAAIVAITHQEAFVGEAKRAFAADMKSAVAIARSGKIYMGHSLRQDTPPM